MLRNGEITPATLVMRDVAQRAGVKPATFYDYFPTKDLLIRALEDRAWAHAAERVRAIMKETDTTDTPLVDAIARIVETFMMEMIVPARTFGLTHESPFGHDAREFLGTQIATFAAEAIAQRNEKQLRMADDLPLRMQVATEAVALLTYVGARDHLHELEDGSYAKAVSRLIAHYFVKD